MAIQIENFDKYELDWNSDSYSTDVSDDLIKYFGNFVADYYKGWSSSDSNPENAPQFFSGDSKYYCGYHAKYMSVSPGKHTLPFYFNHKSDNTEAIRLNVTYYGDPDFSSSSNNYIVHTPIISKMASDGTYGYFLLSFRSFNNDRSGYRSCDIVVRVLEGVDFFDDNTLDTIDAGQLTTSYYDPIDYMKRASDTTTWVTNSTGELAYRLINKTNFSHDILQNGRENSSIIGGSVDNNTVLVLYNNFIVEKYDYDITNNELTLINTRNITYYGVARNVTYDYVLDLGYILVYNNTNDSYKMVAIEPLKGEVWATSPYLPIMKNPSSGTVYTYTLGIVSLHGTIAIVTREIALSAGDPRYLNLWLLKKKDFELIDLGNLATFDTFSINSFDASLDRESTYIGVHSNNWNNQSVKIDSSSFRIFSHIGQNSVNGDSSKDPFWFVAGNISLSNDIYQLEDDLPKTTSVGNIPITPLVGMTCADLTIPFEINPDAWGLDGDAIDIVPTVEGHWYKLDVNVVLPIEVNVTSYVYSLETADIPFTMVSDSWGISHELIPQFNSECWGIYHYINPTMNAIMVMGQDYYGHLTLEDHIFSMYGSMVHYYSDIHLVFNADDYYHKSPFEIEAKMVKEQKYNVDLLLKTLSMNVEMYSGGYADLSMPIDVDIKADFPNVLGALLDIPLKVRTRITQGTSSRLSEDIYMKVKAKMYQTYQMKADVSFKLTPQVKGVVGNDGQVKPIPLKTKIKVKGKNLEETTGSSSLRFGMKIKARSIS